MSKKARKLRHQEWLTRAQKKSHPETKVCGIVKTSDIIGPKTEQPYVAGLNFGRTWTGEHPQPPVGIEYENEVHQMLNQISPGRRKSLEADLVFAHAKQDNDWVTAWRRLNEWLYGNSKHESEIRKYIRFLLREFYLPSPPSKVPMSAWLRECMDEEAAQKIYDEILAELKIKRP
jgi:hypothetical protein